MSSLGGCLLFTFRRSSGRLPKILGSLLLAVALGGFAAGCGSGQTPAVVPKGTYTLTVTGTDSTNSALTASTNLTLIVN